MAVTDLTGTTWTLNDTPTTTYNKLYNINFISNGVERTRLFLSGVIGYGGTDRAYGMYNIAYMPAYTVSIPFFANQNYLLYYSETENIDWKSIQLTYSRNKYADDLSDYQYISLKPNTRYVLCPYRTDARWVAGPAIGRENNGSDSNFLRVSKFSTSTFNMGDFLSKIKYPNYTSNITPVSSSYMSISDKNYSTATAYTTPSAGFTATKFKTIIITGGTDATNADLISWLKANATQILPASFKHYYKNTTLIGTGTYKFRPYTAKEPVVIGNLLTTSSDEILQDSNGNYLEFTLQLSTPQNVTADGTTVSRGAVENATSYEIFADGTSLGIVEGAATDELAGTWVFNDNPDLSGSGAINVNVNFTSNERDFTNMSIIKGSGPSGAIQYDELEVCSSMIGWNNEAYKTITITSKLSEVTNGDTLLAWLQANATKQSSSVNLISFTIAGTSYQAEEGMTW